MTKKLLHRSLLVAIVAVLSACSSHSDPCSGKISGSTSSTSTKTAKKVDTQRLSGLVVRIVDGDTIDILNSEHTLSRVRLQGIDAPEKSQPFGDLSGDHLATLINGKDITIEWRKRDRWGRIVGKILFAGDDVCLEQVKSGFAWHFKRYENEQSEEDRQLYAEAERAARCQKIGLWSGSNQTPPWEIRHPGDSNSDTEGELNSNDLGDSTSNVRRESSSDNHGASTAQDLRPTVRSSNAAPASSNNAEQLSGLIRGNKHSMIYHRPDCPDYDKIAPHNRVPFQTHQEAERAGYRAARNCPTAAP